MGTGWGASNSCAEGEVLVFDGAMEGEGQAEREGRVEGEGGSARTSSVPDPLVSPLPMYRGGANSPEASEVGGRGAWKGGQGGRGVEVVGKCVEDGSVQVLEVRPETGGTLCERV